MSKYIDIGEITEQSYSRLSLKYKNFDDCSIIAKEMNPIPYIKSIFRSDPLLYLINSINKINPLYIKIDLYIPNIHHLLDILANCGSLLSTYINMRWFTNTEKNQIINFCEKRYIFLSKDRYSNSLIIRWP